MEETDQTGNAANSSAWTNRPAMTSIRGPSLSSQKYKSFYYSRVESVAEEDYLDGNTEESSLTGSLNCTEEPGGTSQLVIHPQEAVSQPNVTLIDENDAGGNSEPMLNKGSTSSQSILQYGSPTTRRIRRLLLSPPSLHMSFDVDNNQWMKLSERLNAQKPMSQSSDNVGHRLTVPSAGRDMTLISHQLSPSQRQPVQAVAGYRAHPFEIAQISAEHMRASGLAGQFRGVLSAPLEKGPIQRITKKQSSKDKERQRKDTIGTASKKNSTSSATLSAFFGFGSLHREPTDTEPRQASIDEVDPSIKNVSVDADNHTTPHSVPNDQQGSKQQQSVPPESEPSKSYRLQYHRSLFRQRLKACDYSFILAVIGIVLMITETELTAGGVYTKDTSYSYTLKSLIVLSTVLLLAAVLSYHVIDIKLFMLDYGCDDWRIAIRKGRICKIVLELIVCMICPFPGSYHFTCHSDYIQPADDPSSVQSPSTAVPVDIVLSFPMFLRLYLICRLMLVRSKLFTDGPSRSISTLNRVNITARLVLKMMMTVSPVTVLLAFTGTFWMTAAWIMLVCERYGVQPQQQSMNDHDMKRHQSVIDYESSKHRSYLNSIWLVAVTSLTIGYGDVVPNTYCGRTVSIICGIMGAGTSSLVVAVVAKKLEFSRAEKHVHNFMMDSLLTKRMKNAAANVLRETWLIYKHRKLVKKFDAAKIRYHQRRFLLAIYELRKTKRGRRKLDENFITVGDMAKMTLMTYEMISEMRTRQTEMEQKLVDSDRRCANVEAYLGQLQVSLCALPDLVARKLRAPSPMRM